MQRTHQVLFTGIVLLFLMGLVSPTAFGAADNWISSSGSSKSSWTTSGNWSPSGVPGSSTDVAIGTGTVNGSGAWPIYNDSSDTINSLTIGGASLFSSAPRSLSG